MPGETIIPLPPPELYTRREFLIKSVLTAAGLVAGAVFPGLVKALEENREEETFSSVLVREGDSIYSLCRFYGLPESEIAKNVTTITKRNHLENPDLIFPGRLYLPLSSDVTDFPFKRLALQFEGDKYAGLVSMTNSAEAYGKSSSNLVAHISAWPYVFWGHSQNMGEGAETYPFGRLLRQLLKDPQKVNIWFSRSFGGEKGTWIHCRANKDEVQYITGETNNNDLGRRLWRLPFNSRKIMFCTCATEFGKYDRLTAMATLHFDDYKDPPLYGL